MREIWSPGEWLRRRRKALDLTQDELAVAVGCSKELIAKIEQDARRPSKQVAERIAAQLQLTEAERPLLVRALRAELAADQLPDPGASVPRPTLLASLPAPAPPLLPPAIETPRTNLPRFPTALIGRTREYAEIQSLLAGATPLVTLTGPGGTGKTRLALQVGAEVADQYPDGIWFIDLSPISDGTLVLGAVAQTLGVRESADRPLQAILRDWLRDRRALLILDNCEQVITAAADLCAEILRSAKDVQLLATSRMALRIAGEQEYPVAPLGLPDLQDLPPLDQLSQYDAVALFIARAGCGLTSR